MRRDAAVAEPTAAGASPLAPITTVPTDAVVIDVVERAPRPAEGPGAGRRICHLGTEGDGSEVIRLGCGCKDELGAAYRQCAVAWFRIKGDRNGMAKEWQAPKLRRRGKVTVGDSSPFVISCEQAY